MPCTRALCLHAHMRGRTCAGGSELIKVPSLYLLNVVVQSDDPQRGGEVGAGRDGGAHRRGLAHVSLVGGELEIGSLIVLIQDLDNEVSVGREGVSVILLGLERAKGNILSVIQSNIPVHTLIQMWTLIHINLLPLQMTMNIPLVFTNGRVRVQMTAKKSHFPSFCLAPLRKPQSCNSFPTFPHRNVLPHRDFGCGCAAGAGDGELSWKSSATENGEKTSPQVFQKRLERTMRPQGGDYSAGGDTSGSSAVCRKTAAKHCEWFRAGSVRPQSQPSQHPANIS